MRAYAEALVEQRSMLDALELEQKTHERQRTFSQEKIQEMQRKHHRLRFAMGRQQIEVRKFEAYSAVRSLRRKEYEEAVDVCTEVETRICKLIVQDNEQRETLAMHKEDVEYVN